MGGPIGLPLSREAVYVEPLSPTQYDVIPKQWVTLQHPKFGDVIAAMLPYPTLDEGALCAGDPAWTDEDVMRSSIKRTYIIDMCKRCPISNACREYAIAHEGHGIWGGTLPDERAAIRRERKQIMVEPHYAHVYGLADDYFSFLMAGGSDAESEANGTQGSSEVA